MNPLRAALIRRQAWEWRSRLRQKSTAMIRSWQLKRRGGWWMQTSCFGAILGAIVVGLVFSVPSNAASPVAEWHPLPQRAGKAVANKDARPLPVRRPVEMNTLAEIGPDGALLTRCSEFTGLDFSRRAENSERTTVRSEKTQ